MASSDPHLKRIYRRYNAKYFENQLPDNTVIYWAPNHERLASTFQIGGIHHIEMDPTLMVAQRFIHIMLLHEMRHISLDPYGKHGDRWKSAGRRLMELGAYDDWF
jgi:SprT-like family